MMGLYPGTSYLPYSSEYAESMIYKIESKLQLRQSTMGVSYKPGSLVRKSPSSLKYVL